MLRKLTCIICPNGCEMTVEAEDGQDIEVMDALCPRGKAYAIQEITNPMRTISTSVLVEGGELPLASVRLTNPIPKAMIMAAMAEIKKVRLQAPVTSDTVVIHHILGQDSDVIVTKTVDKR